MIVPLDCFSHLNNVSSVLKGVLWLLLATVAEVPGGVSSEYSCTAHFPHHRVMSQVFIILNLNGISVFLWP